MRSLVDILRQPSRQPAKPAKLKARMRFAAGKAIRLRGRGAVGKARSFEGSAYNGGVMYPELVVNGQREDGPVVLDLDSLVIPRPQRPVLYDHDESIDGVIGHTTSIAVRKSDYTLPAQGIVFSTLPQSAAVLDEAAAGREWQLSVGLEGFALQRIAAGQVCRVNGRSFCGPLTVVRNAELTDLSFVRKGGDESTWAALAARRNRRNQHGNAATKRLVDAMRSGPQSTRAAR